MRIVIAVAVFGLAAPVARAAAPPALPPDTEAEVRFLGQVLDVSLGCDVEAARREPATVVLRLDVDPRFCLAVTVREWRGASGSFAVGSKLLLRIHSPALFFGAVEGGSWEDKPWVGKQYLFVHHRRRCDGGEADCITVAERFDPARGPISTAAAPAAIGPYSQAFRAGDTLYLAGQIGLDPAAGKLVEGGTEAETRQALENLEAVLAAAGYRLDEVVQAQVFLTDLEDFDVMNRVYAGYFPENPPARATVQVAALPRGARVEIALIAVRR